MKKIILLSFIIITCVSCKYEERGNLTQNGKEMFDTWQSGTQLVMDNVVRPIFLVNAWIASDSAGRIAIEDQYFPQYKIRQYDSNTFRIMDGARPILTITTNGQNALGEQGSVWEITDKIEYVAMGSYVADIYPQFAFSTNTKHLTITNIGNNKFTIMGDSISYVGSQMEWQLSFPIGEIPADIYTSAFEMSGSGCFSLPTNRSSYNAGNENNPVALHYDIEQSLKNFINEELKWGEGKMQLTARMEGKEAVEAGAKIISKDEIEITYKGITERWYK